MSEAHWCQCESCTQDRISAAERIQQLRRALDNIKIRAWELGQPELHDMTLAALKTNDNE